MPTTQNHKEGAILIIDSDPKDLIFAKSVLMTDFDIMIAPSVNAAERISGQPKPDLILMMLDMADATQALVQMHGAPVIFAGKNDVEAEIAAYKLGGLGYVKKPYHAELLKQQVITLYHVAATIEGLRKSLKRETLLGQSTNIFSYDFKGIRILVAEDVHLNQLIVANMLGNNNIEIDFADDGAMAVEMFSAAPDAYAAILMDIHMPHMDGITATRIIRSMDTARNQKIPIIALTASITPDDMRNYKRLGMNAILDKPVDPEPLLRTLIELISG